MGHRWVLSGVVDGGRQAAMEMGDGARALKFYQTALRADPDQAQVGREYKKLKAPPPTACRHTATQPPSPRLLGTLHGWLREFRLR